MTSTQHDPRLEAARRIFEQAHPRLTFLYAERDGIDAKVYFGTGVDISRIYAADIDLVLAPEPAKAPSLVERLKAHGLTTYHAPDGGVTITASAIEALSLANALDKLEALS